MEFRTLDIYLKEKTREQKTGLTEKRSFFKYNVN